jgi:O-antigen/teichoic acid export membrane protein
VLRKFIGHSSLYVLARIIGSIIPFIAVPLIARELGVELFGRYDFFLVAASFAQILIGGSSSAALNFFYYEKNTEHEREILVKSLSFWNIFPGAIISFLITLFIYIISGYLFDKQLEYNTYIAFAFLIIFQQYCLYVVGVLRIAEKALILLLYQVLSNGIATGFGILGLILVDTNTVMIFFIFSAFGYLIFSILGHYYIFRILHKSKTKISYTKCISLWKDQQRFGLPMMPGLLAEYGLSFADRFVGSFFLSGYEYGLYAIAARIASIAQIGIQGVSFAFLPFSMKLIHSDEEDSSVSLKLDLIWRYLSFFYLSLISGAFIFADKITEVFGGSLFSDAKYIFPFLMLSYVIYSYTYFSYLGTLKFKKTGYFSFAVLIGCIVTICMSAVFMSSHLFSINSLGNVIGRLVGAGLTLILSFYFSQLFWPLKWSFIRVFIQTFLFFLLILVVTIMSFESISYYLFIFFVIVLSTLSFKRKDVDLFRSLI